MYPKLTSLSQTPDMGLPLDSNLHRDDGRPLLATFHNNGSVISLDSTDSEVEDAPGSLETHRHSGTKMASTDATTKTQARPSYEVDRTSNHRIARSNRPPVPLALPEIFRKPSSLDAHVFAHRSRDGPPQAVHAQKSTPLAASSLSGSRQLGEQHTSVDHVDQKALVPSRHSSISESSTLAPDSSTLKNNERHRSTSTTPQHSLVARSTYPPPSHPEGLSTAPERPALLKGELALPRRTISHSGRAQKLMERLKISWCVQYELARGELEKKWTWDDVTTQVLERLQGSNSEAAPRVHTVMSESLGEGGPVRRADSKVAGTNSNLWREYDREQDAILEGQSRGLGLRGEWKGVPDWYGGRIEQTVKLSKVGGDFTYRLVRPALKKSTRFARFLGSRRILKIKLPKNLRFEKDGGVIEHLSRPFVLCGRVFVPFASKEGNAYLMEVDEDEDRKPDSAQGDNARMSLWDFIQWHNPFALNENQALSKWSSRFDLGLSTTVPVLQFEPRNITFIEDIHAPHNEGEKVPTEKILTDGCGFINGAALTLIARRLKLPSRPTAVQGRVAGSKGLWILHPEDRSHTGPPRIWIRSSQQKVKLPKLEEGSAHVIFDVITQSNHIKVPARLNYQTVINLAENGVDSEVFQGLMREGLTQTFSSLTQWDGPGAMPLLWNAVNNLGGVTRTRLQKIAHGLERALGLSNRFEMDRKDEEDDPDSDDEDSSLASDEKPLYQTVLELIQAGFDPRSSPILYEKMRYVVKQAMDRHLDKFHLEVHQSAEAFIVPDPFNVLEEGEIHFKSSQELGDPLTETNVYCIRGPVLVSRNPTMVASDIQKVEAVEHEQLADYVNVVVFSTRGPRSLASLLGGGDYDGDTVMVNWDASVVEKFKKPKVVDKPHGLEEIYFEAHVEHVTSFHHRHAGSSPDEVQGQLLSAMLRSLENANVGTYNKYHAYAAYTKGYSDPETIRLAYMFTTCLDSRKTGHCVRQNVLTQDGKRYGRGLPECMQHVETDEWSEKAYIIRNKGLAPFVLDSLREFGKELGDSFLSAYEKLSGPPGVTKFTTLDRHLLGPYQQVLKKLSEMESLPGVNTREFILEARAELRMIEDHVNTLRVEWSSPLTHKKKSGSTQTRAIPALRRKFALGPDVPHLSLLGNIPAIHASYAYGQCRADNPKFAFAMAFEELCKIKAQELRGTMLDCELAELMTVPKTAVRTLSTIRSLT